MKKNNRNLGLSKFCACLAVCTFFLIPSQAYSTFISPPRVIIDAGQPTGTMLILNRSEETKLYSFAWQDRAMNEDTTIAKDEDVKKIKNYRPASEILVYSPRQAILEPGQSQRIRFFVKRDKMTDGEYRSHILVKGRSVNKEEKEKVTTGLGGTISLVPQAGIPVMVRHGKTVVEIEPQVFELIKEDGKNYLHAKFINKSTRTLYAKPTIFCERDGLEQPEEIDVMSIRLYYEGVYFDEKLPVRAENPNFEGCRSIRLEFTDPLDFQYKTKSFYTQVLK